MHYKYVCLFLLRNCDLEKWPSNEQRFLPLMRTGVRVPVPTRQLTAVSSPSYRVSRAVFCPPTLLATGVHWEHPHICRSTCAQFFKKILKSFKRVIASRINLASMSSGVLSYYLRHRVSPPCFHLLQEDRSRLYWLFSQKL